VRTPHTSIRNIRIPTNLARLPAWARADRLEAIDLPWRNDTPAERAQREARQAVSQAERRYTAQVRDRRRALAKAERAHEQAVRRAQNSLAEAERSGDRQIRSTEAAIRSATSGGELRRFLQLRLYEDRLVTPEVAVPVEPGLRAVVGTDDTVRALASPYTRSRLQDRHAPGRHVGPRRLRGGHTYLLVETGATSILVPCDEQAKDADAFAQAVNVTALNADRLAARRMSAAGELVGELQERRSRRDAAVAEAHRALEDVESDTAAIDSARAELAAAEADTAEVDRARAELERVQESVP
jgi:hypothetical protein